MNGVICPECGSAMVLRSTDRFVHRDGTTRRFFGCSRFPDCRATHGAHPDGSPYGIPGDAATKEARVRAHEAFDRLWKSGGMSRKAAYRRMQSLMGMTRDDAHIGRFDVGQCEKLIALLDPNKDRGRRAAHAIRPGVDREDGAPRPRPG